MLSADFFTQHAKHCIKQCEPHQVKLCLQQMLTVQTSPIIYLTANVHPSGGCNYRIYPKYLDKVI